MAEMPGAYVATGRRACDVIYFLRRELPDALQVLTELALDLRWTWSHAGDALWQTISPETWEQMRNPWTILQDVTLERLEQLAQDTRFMAKLQRLVAERAQYLNQPGWYGRHYRGIGAKGRRQPALPARLLSANARCQRQTAGGLSL